MYNWNWQRLKIMEFKLIEHKHIVSLLVVLFACFCKNLCQPETTTPKVYKDKFPLNKQTRPIPPNSSLNERVQEAFRSGFMMDSPNRKLEVDNSKSLDKVRAVNLGDRTMKEIGQNDDDDDYDDGEYSGLKGLKPPGTGGGGQKKKESMPLVLFRELDMVAMEIPVKCKEKNDISKEKTTLSSCNNDINNLNNAEVDPFQNHWKPKADGIKQMEQKMRTGLGYNFQNENPLGIDVKEGSGYDMKDVGNELEQGTGEKREVPYGLAGRRDLEYILNEKRESPYKTRQRSRGFQYFK